MLGLGFSDSLVVPGAVRDMEGELGNILGVPKGFYGQYVHENALLLDNVLVGFQSLYRSEILPCTLDFGEARKNACLLLILGTLLLRGEVEMCSLRCLTLVKPIKKRGRLGPLILGETILGLDACTKGETSFFRGCPLLLYMWLCEKFMMVKPAKVPYLPKHFLARGKSPKMSAIEASGAWYSVFDMEDVEWLNSHFDLNEVVISTGTYRGVPLPTLNYIAFYYPWWVLCHAGHHQAIVQLPSKDCHNRVMVSEAFKYVHSIWHKKNTIFVIPTLVDGKMDPDYHVWLVSDLASADRESTKRQRMHTGGGTGFSGSVSVSLSFTGVRSAWD